jgi:hypothetical protein
MQDQDMPYLDICSASFIQLMRKLSDIFRMKPNDILSFVFSSILKIFMIYLCVRYSVQTVSPSNLEHKTQSRIETWQVHQVALK